MEEGLELQKPDGEFPTLIFIGIQVDDQIVNDKLVILLAVNPEIEERRAELKKDRAQLLEAKICLQKLEHGTAFFDDTAMEE